MTRWKFSPATSELRRRLRDHLRQSPDLSRALARLSVGRGGPRDLANIRDAIKAARESARRSGARFRWRGEAAGALDAMIQGIAAVSRAGRPAGIAAGGRAAFYARDGGFIRAGVHAPLDEVRALRDESRRVIAGLESQIPPGQRRRHAAHQA